MEEVVDRIFLEWLGEIRKSYRSPGWKWGGNPNA